MDVPQHYVLPEEYCQRYLAQPRGGNLVTVHDDGPEATYVPFHLDAERGVLVTHLARSNPQAHEPLTGPGLVILDIDDAYISPHWYATNKVTPNVPTWDYLTIHIRGAVTIDDSPEAALKAACALSAAVGEAHSTEAVGKERLERMSRAIVSVEVAMEEVRGKAKMSQDRHPEDIRSLVRELQAQGYEQMAAYLNEVSLPYAQAQFATIDPLPGGRGHGPALRSAGKHP